MRGAPGAWWLSNVFAVRTVAGVKHDGICFSLKTLWEWNMISHCTSMNTHNCVHMVERVPEDHFQSPVFALSKMCDWGALGPFPAAHVFGATPAQNSGGLVGHCATSLLSTGEHFFRARMPSSQRVPLAEEVSLEQALVVLRLPGGVSVVPPPVTVAPQPAPHISLPWLYPSLITTAKLE